MSKYSVVPQLRSVSRLFVVVRGYRESPGLCLIDGDWRRYFECLGDQDRLVGKKEGSKEGWRSDKVKDFSCETDK